MADAYRVQLSGDASGNFTVTRERPLTLGRGADVIVDESAALRRQCRLEVSDEGLIVRDLASLSGTKVNGWLIQDAPLGDGDKLQFGSAEIAVRVSEADASMPDVVPSGGQAGLVKGVAKRLGGEGFADLQFIDSSPTVLIYNAKRKNLDQPVTLKVLKPGAAASTSLKRFVREAKIAAKLAHPNIVRLFDARSQKKLIYMVLERYEGRTLLEEIEVAGRLDPSRALAIALPVAKAIVYAHEQGVIHRDVNPANVLITDTGAVKLIDFGLAKSIRDMGQQQLTRVGEAIGAEAYASPEQLAEGRAANEFSDLFGVGATLYHMLTGAPPFEVGVARLDPQPVEAVVEDTPPAVATIVRRCMSKEPTQRYWSAKQLLQVIEQAIREVHDLHEGPVNLELLTQVSSKTDTQSFNVTQRMRPLDLGAAVDGNKKPQFVGTFHGHELIELVQMLEVNRKTGLLQVLPDGDATGGSILFREGKAVKARSGEKQGEDAIIDVLSLEHGIFRFFAHAIDVDAEQETSIGPLLMEVMRRRDEAARRAARGTEGWLEG